MTEISPKGLSRCVETETKSTVQALFEANIASAGGSAEQVAFDTQAMDIVGTETERLAVRWGSWTRKVRESRRPQLPSSNSAAEFVYFAVFSPPESPTHFQTLGLGADDVHCLRVEGPLLC